MATGAVSGPGAERFLDGLPESWGLIVVLMTLRIALWLF
jgi:hypothetical protein